MYATPTLATRFANSTRVLRSDMPLSEDADAPGRAVHLRRRQARQPLRALHLHPDHRRAARPAPRRLRALHGRAGAQPHRRQERVHQAHDPHAPRARVTGRQHPARGQRDHPHQQPRRRQLVPAAVPACSASSAATAWWSATWRDDIRIPHKGNVQGEVIEGAFRVLDDFEAVDESRRAGEYPARSPRIILINSHDGASSYQLLCGMFRQCPAGHRRNYVQRRTMSRWSGAPEPARLSMQRRCTAILLAGHVARKETTSWNQPCEGAMALADVRRGRFLPTCPAFVTSLIDTGLRLVCVRAKAWRAAAFDAWLHAQGVGLAEVARRACRVVPAPTVSASE